MKENERDMMAADVRGEIEGLRVPGETPDA
jgi:hypothetical protein